MSVAYQRPIEMRILIDCFLVQTNPNWRLLMVHDGEGNEEVRATSRLYNDPRITYVETSERHGEYGHPNRKSFLEELISDRETFILLTNDDNYYCPVFVDMMLAKCDKNTGFVYCDTVHSHFKYDVLKTTVKVDRIDIGAFIVRADVARVVGFHNFAFNGDGYYAEECADYCRKHNLGIKCIPKPIFVHN